MQMRTMTGHMRSHTTTYKQIEIAYLNIATVKELGKRAAMDTREAMDNQEDMDKRKQ